MANIRINSDKTISIDGKKIFPINMWGVVPRNGAWDFMEDPVTSLSKVAPNFLIDFGSAVQDTPLWIHQHESANMFFLQGPRNTDYTSPYFFGTQLYQEPDYLPDNAWYFESECGLSNTSISCTHAAMRNLYLSKKQSDPNHPCILPIMGMGESSSFKYWSDATDILTTDRWVYRDEVTGNRRDLSVFFYEIDTYDSVMWGISGNLNNISVPVWLGIQGIGKTNQSAYYVLNDKEMREQIYCAITMNCNGLAVWGYNIWASAKYQYGLSVNPTAFNVLNNIASEIKLINDILVLPTESHRWARYKSNDIVSLTGTYTTLVTSWGRNFQEENFNWILKDGGVNKYLIVMNKGNQAITTTINISSLIGTHKVTVIGNQTTGSGAAGKTLTISGTSFQDTFDAHVVHIYAIEVLTTPPPPPPTQTVDITTTIKDHAGGRAHVVSDLGTYDIVNTIYTQKATPNTDVTWTAIPDTGYVFKNFIDQDTGFITTVNPLTMKATGNLSIVVVFSGSSPPPPPPAPPQPGVGTVFGIAGLTFLIKEIFKK